MDINDIQLRQIWQQVQKKNMLVVQTNGGTKGSKIYFRLPSGTVQGTCLNDVPAGNAIALLTEQENWYLLGDSVQENYPESNTRNIKYSRTSKIKPTEYFIGFAKFNLSTSIYSQKSQLLAISTNKQTYKILVKQIQFDDFLYSFHENTYPLVTYSSIISSSKEPNYIYIFFSRYVTSEYSYSDAQDLSKSRFRYIKLNLINPKSFTISPWFYLKASQNVGTNAYSPADRIIKYFDKADNSPKLVCVKCTSDNTYNIGAIYIWDLGTPDKINIPSDAACNFGHYIFYTVSDRENRTAYIGAESKGCYGVRGGIVLEMRVSTFNAFTGGDSKSYEYRIFVPQDKIQGSSNRFLFGEDVIFSSDAQQPNFKLIWHREDNYQLNTLIIGDIPKPLDTRIPFLRQANKLKDLLPGYVYAVDQSPYAHERLPPNLYYWISSKDVGKKIYT